MKEICVDLSSGEILSFVIPDAFIVKLPVSIYLEYKAIFNGKCSHHFGKQHTLLADGNFVRICKKCKKGWFITRDFWEKELPDIVEIKPLQSREKEPDVE